MDDDLDLEDLEVMLYSQVFYGNSHDETMRNAASRTCDSSPENVLNTNRTDAKRYYNAASKNCSIITQPYNNAMHAYSVMDNRCIPIPAASFYVQQPVNNIVLIPPPAPVISTSKYHKRYSRLLKLKEKIKRRKAVKLEKRRRQKERREKLKNSSILKNLPTENSKNKSVVIVNEDIQIISDDDNPEKDISKEVKQESNLLKSKKGIDKIEKEINYLEDDDDVIYVPPDVKDNEIISLDSDDDDIEKSKRSDKTLCKKNITPSERKEMLSTPESTTSNDFLDNSAITTQESFNFNLYGSDFVPDPTTQFLRPKTPADNTEIYETESSCSATDINVTPTESVFQEIEFESPKDLFQDMENFGNYIVPKRNIISNILNNLPKEREPMNISTVSVDRDSESSSESEYDSQVSTISKDKIQAFKSNQELPDLSAIEVVEDDDILCNKQTGEKPTNYDDACDNLKRKCDEKQELSFKKTKTATNECDISNCTNDVIGLNESSNSTSSVILLSELKNLHTDLSLANCTDVYKPRTLSEYCTSDIRKFYKQDWNLENFTMDKILSTMSDDENKWRILDCDRSSSLNFVPKRRRCCICRQTDHHPSKCSKSRMPIKCSLCGQPNHTEPRCPNKMCTQCGNRSDFTTVYCKYCIHERRSKCKICQLTGHIKARCPDLWRRYHITTTETEPVVPEGPQVKPFHKRWCSNCGSNGHFSYKCRLRSLHPAIDPAVKSYKDLYGFKKSTSSEAGSFKINESKISTSLEPGGSNINEIKVNTEVVHKENLVTNEQMATPSNIQIKLNNTMLDNNQFSQNRQFFVEPLLQPGITIQGENCYQPNPVVYQIPPYLPFMNANIPINYNLNNDLHINERKALFIDYKEARFFIEDIPGIDFIHYLESECNAMIKVSLDHQRNGVITIMGTRKSSRVIKVAIRMYIGSCLHLLLIPSKSPILYTFLRNIFKNDSKNKIKQSFKKFKHCEQKYKITTDIEEKLRLTVNMAVISFTLNKAYTNCNFKETKSHLDKLKDVYSKTRKGNFELTQAQIEEIKEFYYFLYYKRRTLKDYARAIYAQ